MPAFWLTYSAWLVSELYIWRRDRPISGAAKADDQGSRAGIVVVMIVSITAAFVVASKTRAAAIDVQHVKQFGLGVMIAGIALRLWSVRTLGAFFRTKVTILSDHSLVRTGPYRLVRHPAYTGALMTCVGLGFALGNWAALGLLVIVPAAAYFRRIRIEERLLAAQFGAQWQGHARATWVLLPFVW